MSQLLSYETIVKASEATRKLLPRPIPLCRIYPLLCENGRTDQHRYAGTYRRAADRKPVEVPL